MIRFGTVLAAAAILATGCAQQKGAVIDQALDKEPTYDGLVQVRNPSLQYAWVRPEADLSSYQRVTFRTADFQFRAVKPMAGTGTARGTRDEFPIGEAERTKLVETVNQIFREELAKSRRYTYTDETGPDVVMMEVALLDIVSRVPPEPVGRSDIFLDEVGEATLVVTLRDSQSGETLARAADRRAAEPVKARGNFGALRSSPVTTWAEVRRLARRWATRASERLDQLHDLTRPK